jgi:hypothetical protein
MASFGDAWKVGSGLIVIAVPPCLLRGAPVAFVELAQAMFLGG